MTSKTSKTSKTPATPKISKTVLRFKITLVGIRPPIWRRIEVPGNYTFWDLHSAIQDAMGWENYHLHEFRPGLYDPRNAYQDDGLSIGIPDREFGRVVFAGWMVRLNQHFRESGDRGLYLYDFGDDWIHRVVLEAKQRRPEGIPKPVCLGGKRACPPEDCGGVGGYYDLVDALAGKTDESERYREPEFYEAYRDYDPADFHPARVVFLDPKQRLEEWRGSGPLA